MRKEDALRLELLIRKVGIGSADLGVEIKNYEEWYIDRDGDLILEKAKPSNWLKRLFHSRTVPMWAVSKNVVIRVVACKILNLANGRELEMLERAIIHQFKTNDYTKLLCLLLNLSDSFRWSFNDNDLSTEDIVRTLSKNRHKDRTLKVKEIIHECDNNNNVIITTPEGIIKFNRQEIDEEAIRNIIGNVDREEVYVSQRTAGEPITVVEKTTIRGRKDYERKSSDSDRGFC